MWHGETGGHSEEAQLISLLQLGSPHGTVNGGVRPVWHGETGLQSEETQLVSLLQLGFP